MKEFRRLFKEKTNKEAVTNCQIPDLAYVEFLESELSKSDVKSVEERLPVNTNAYDVYTKRYMKEYGVTLTLTRILFACTEKMVELDISKKYPRRLKKIKKIRKILDNMINKICIAEKY